MPSRLLQHGCVSHLLHSSRGCKADGAAPHVDRPCLGMFAMLATWFRGKSRAEITRRYTFEHRLMCRWRSQHTVAGLHSVSLRTLGRQGTRPFAHRRMRTVSFVFSTASLRSRPCLVPSRSHLRTLCNTSVWAAQGHDQSLTKTRHHSHEPESCSRALQLKSPVGIRHASLSAIESSQRANSCSGLAVAVRRGARHGTVRVRIVGNVAA